MKSHPFPVVARFERVVAVSFAFPEGTLRPLVPDSLEIDAYEGFGFLTVSLVWTRRLRPAGFPEFLGRDFFLAGYRVFTRLRTTEGRTLRGLTILRSDTDSRQMVWAGNLMTGYRYQHVRTFLSDGPEGTDVKTSLPDGTPQVEMRFDAQAVEPLLPAGSPFPDWHAARRFAGPMPFTFSPQANGSFVVVEGGRTGWTPRPVRLDHWKVALFDEPPFRGVAPLPANAFAVDDIEYRWEKGRIMWPEKNS